MKNEQGFSLVELLIVVAIIAIIAAIAVPSLLTSRMAANEAGGIEGCRSAGTAEIAYAATNNQMYTNLATLVTNNYLDSRFTNGFNGYTYTDAGFADDAGNAWAAGQPAGSAQFAIQGVPVVGMARYTYGIAPDQVVRWLAGVPIPAGMVAGAGIGKK